ncbi:MAG: glycosyltransferase family 2 protein [Anaerolineales bacterium]|nr:glycosyltransferase family 2 protein [Anaerolineales bacterium]
MPENHLDTPNKKLTLAVVVVSYNVRELLRQCLASVLASAARTQDRLSVEIVVIDNASRDGSAGMVAAEFPAVRLAALAYNSGFTGGNNLALYLLGFPVELAHAAPGEVVPSLPRPDYVLLLNPDTTVTGEALWLLVACLESHPGAGACGARLTYGDGGFQHSAFHYPSVVQVFLDFFPLSRLPGSHRLHRGRINGRYSSHLWRGAAPFPVDFVLGAALMVRGATVAQVGGLDDGYWMYCEEMDWCLRMRDAGWLTLVAPTAHVVHYEAQSSRQLRWEMYERLWRSRFRFYAKHRDHFPPFQLPLVRRIVRSGIALRRRAIQKAFAGGKVTGSEAAAAMAAFAAIAQQ